MLFEKRRFEIGVINTVDLKNLRLNAVKATITQIQLDFKTLFKKPTENKKTTLSDGFLLNIMLLLAYNPIYSGVITSVVLAAN
ncbi:hypothetical protein [Lacihabitans sp. CCS-44]|uniref:hypothetical protein n=1 Tax=Lacihabitans sp. CCS-44 TaxID=2487331 RepID=UPI0020CD7727|nr:hypothetical protein [Lacihabitans sp. CCS-44]